MITCFVLLAGGCASTKSFEYKGVNNFAIADVFDEPKVAMDLNLHNPNPFGVTIRNFDLGIDVSGKPLGIMSIEDKVRIKRRSDFVMPVQFSTDIGSLGGILASGLTAFAGDDAMPVGLHGTITLQKFIFFRRTYAFDYQDDLRAKDILHK